MEEFPTPKSGGYGGSIESTNTTDEQHPYNSGGGSDIPLAIQLQDEKILGLEKKLEDSIAESIKTTENVKNSMKMISNLVIAVLVVFAVALVSISIDYIYNNEIRYEKFVDKTEEIKDSFYSKKEVDTQFIDFKKCIRLIGLSNCVK